MEWFALMGRRVHQRKLFYYTSLEERIPQDHLLRRISSVIDFSFIYDYVRCYYSHTGSPSVDPVVIFKMALLGYLCGIPSYLRPGFASEERFMSSSFATLSKYVRTEDWYKGKRYS